jgi:APA family basic amino acid/polyamine antiporter
VPAVRRPLPGGAGKGAHAAGIGRIHPPARGDAARMTGLARVVGRWQLFALAFGCIVGSGWVVVLGEWLAAAAPGGAVVGFLAGATVILAVCAGYAELVARIPVAGGEFEYSRRIFGPRTAFLVGWFSTLSLLAVVSFEGIALGWILGVLLPATQGPVLYRLFDADVTAGGALIGVGGAIALGVFNYRGISGAARLQAAVTFTFIGLVAAVIVTGLVLGSADNIEPWFTPLRAQSWWTGSLWIFACAPFFLNGFQSVPQLIEERAAGITFTTVARAMYAAIGFGCAFYCGVIVAAAMATHWTGLPGRELPAAAAFESLLPAGLLTRLILIAAALSVVKTWNGILLWAARLLMAQARAHFLPSALSRIHPRFGSPFIAVVTVTAINVCGVLLGRGVLVPLLNMSSICSAFTMVLATVAALRLRALPGWQAPPYAAPGGRITLLYGLAGVVVMALFAAVDPVLRTRHGVPLEWLLMLAWAVLGGAAWHYKARHSALTVAEVPEPG